MLGNSNSSPEGQGAILRNAGLKVDVFVLVAMEARSGMDKDGRNAFELLLAQTENAVEGTVDATIIIGHHGGNLFIVTATGHALAELLDAMSGERERESTCINVVERAF